jgi:PAS domain S-box-containing protein
LALGAADKQILSVPEHRDISDRQDHARIEDALRESETRLEIATEAAELGIWDWNLLTGKLVISERTKLIFGFEPGSHPTIEEMYGFTHPEDRPKVSSLIRRALDSSVREQVAYQYRILRPDGAIRWVMAHGKSVFGWDGGSERALRYVGTIQDITERKEAEAALQESEARLKAVADNIPLSMIYQIISARDGSERKFVYVSRNCLAVNGVPAEQVLANPSLIYDQVLPEHIPVLAEAEQKALRALEPLDVEIATQHGISGEVRWFRLVWAPRPASDDKLIWDGVQIDITEHKQAEEAVKASEERLRFLLERMPVGVALADITTGEMLFQNAMLANLLGAQLRSISDLKLTRPETAEHKISLSEPAGYSILDALSRGDTVEQEELAYHRNDGQLRHLAVSASLLQGLGAEDLALSTFYDITERRAAEEHLRLLVNELNHRVKNTLTIVQSLAAQSMRDVRASDQDAPFSAKDAFEARLFALSRAHDVLTRESWESVSLKDIVAEATAPYRSGNAGNDPFEISSEDIRLTPQVALSLSMALHELCTNAVKYGALREAEGRVSITCSEHRTPHGRAISILWKETGGPPVYPPRRKGFGTRLIEQGLARELNGEVCLAYEPTGLVCRIEVPLTEDSSP